MKILYIMNGSNFASAGGMEYHLVDITKWFQKKGIETACAVRKGTLIETKLLGGWTTVYPLQWTGVSKIIGFFQLCSAILRFSPDVISINRERDIKRAYYTTKLLSFMSRKRPKLVAIFQNVGWRDSFRLAKLDGLIFVNDYTSRDYLSWNVDAESISRKIYYGIPLPDVDLPEKMNTARKRRYFRDLGFPLIGMVGEFRKNQSELIDVAFHLKHKLKSFTIAFIGRGTDAETAPLKEKIERLGLTDHFLFAGQVDHAHMPDVYYDLDISVTTNKVEAFGIVFIESLAGGTPLVAFSSGGPVEILKKGGGMLVDGGPEEMAERIYRLLTDHTVRNELSQTARSVAEEHYSFDAMAEKHLKFYRELIAK